MTKNLIACILSIIFSALCFIDVWKAINTLPGKPDVSTYLVIFWGIGFLALGIYSFVGIVSTIDKADSEIKAPSINIILKNGYVIENISSNIVKEIADGINNKPDKTWLIVWNNGVTPMECIFILDIREIATITSQPTSHA